MNPALVALRKSLAAQTAPPSPTELDYLLEDVSKAWTDAARAASAAARRGGSHGGASRSLGQAVAAGPRKMRHKKGERATTQARRQASANETHAMLSRVVDAEHAATRPHRQAGIAAAKA